MASTFWIPSSVHGSGYSCSLFLKFEKYVYSSEKVVPIGIEDNCQINSGKTVTLIVSNADQALDPSTGWPTLEKGIYFDKEVVLDGQFTTVNFEIPQSTQEYRFLVTLKDERSEILDESIFFTKDRADIISFSDVVVPEAVSGGSELAISLKLIDGLEYPVPSIVTAMATLKRPECDQQTSPPIPVDIRLDRTVVGNEVVYQGSTIIPSDFPSGIYDVAISVYSPPSKGYRYPNPDPLKVQIENGGVPVTTLFYNIEQLGGSIFSKISNDVRYVVGDDIVIKGQALTDDCLPLAGIQVVGDLYAHPTPLIRSSAVTDEYGNFTLHFQTYPRLQSQTQYFLTLKGEYLNKTYTWDDYNVSLDDVKKFPFEVEGLSSTAEAQVSGGGKIVSLTLDEKIKKITVVLESQKNEQAQYTLAIPSELLSGDIIIIKDGGEPLTLVGEQNFADMHGPEMDLARGDARHSYSLMAHKMQGLMVVYYFHIAGGRTTLEISGTTAIPEFGPVVLAVAAASMVGVMIYRKRV